MHGRRETGGVKLVRVWFIVLLGDGVVDRQRIRLGGAAHSNINHRFRLERGAVFVGVRVVVEVDTREEGEPHARVQGRPMNQLKRGGEFPVNLGWDLVGHPARVLDGVEPEVPRHLRSGEVRSRHGAHRDPRTLYQSFGGLSASGGGR